MDFTPFTSLNALRQTQNSSQATSSNALHFVLLSALHININNLSSRSRIENIYGVKTKLLTEAYSTLFVICAVNHNHQFDRSGKALDDEQSEIRLVTLNRWIYHLMLSEFLNLETESRLLKSAVLPSPFHLRSHGMFLSTAPAVRI